MAHAKICYIVGHRGTGKSTAGRAAAEMCGGDFVDLDEVVERREGASCAEIIAESEAKFRNLERACRRRVVEEHDRGLLVVALGGGYRPVPTDGLVVWLYRDGWVQAARSGRHRLHPELDFSDELDWMIRRREPRWEQAADLRVDVPRGRPPARVARDLATYLDWFRTMADSALTRRTWVVAPGPERLSAAARLVEMTGLAGVEIRSDLVPADAVRQLPGPTIASVRGDDLGWLERLADRGAGAFDIDLAHLGPLLASDLLDELEPRPLILSAHPPVVESDPVARFRRAVDAVASRHPSWADRMTVKYAPEVDGLVELSEALETREALHRGFESVTYLVQGADYAWTRPLMAGSNATNYLPVGLAARRRRHTEARCQTPWDLQDWLPHLAPPEPEQFEGLLGDPVRHSQGDRWHRRAAERPVSYLPIPVDAENERAELSRLLDLLTRWPIRGLSVTSPLKRSVADLDNVRNPGRLEAGNTLRRVVSRSPGGPSWELSDTDAVGMRASLRAAEWAGVEPGTVAIIGTGGVAPALVRAVQRSNWQLVHHALGRRGWTDDAPESVTMVVNAIGDRDNAYRGPPDCTVWLDLHYVDVRPPPTGVEVHLNGDPFFDGQAAAQRKRWAEAELSAPDHE